MELGIPVVAAAQVNRQAENRSDNRPKLSDLRESGSIEQDADIVCLVHRPCYYAVQDQEPDPQDAELIVAKHRAGRTGTLNLTWRPSLTRFDGTKAQPNIAAARLTDSNGLVYAPDKQLWEAINE
jgi:replicative DNA helicase